MVLPDTLIRFVVIRPRPHGARVVGIRESFATE